MIPFMAPSMLANVGLGEAQLPLIYLAGGVATFCARRIVGRLSDRHDKLHVPAWISVASALAAIVVTNLPPAPVGVATALFMVTMSGRFSPAMAMLTNAVEPRYRGGFMSVNSAVQQAASGVANAVAGAMIVATAGGRLTGYRWVGLLSVGCMVLTVFLAFRLRAIAPPVAAAAPASR
jgi:predicted MFS family arabinose efflux permease